jgi:nitric oxide reductase NorD protein
VHKTFNQHELKQILEPYFFDGWTVEEVAQCILSQQTQWQQYVLNWVTNIAQTQPELAYQFALRAHTALDIIDQHGTEQWLQSTLDSYYSSGLYPAMQEIRNLQQFIDQYQRMQKGTSLDKIKAVLENFLHGLNGRQLKIQSHESIYTDTETLYLPEVICESEDQKSNFAIYKAMAVHQWAQTWYGTWRVDLTQALSGYSSPEQAMQRFHQLETLRLDACIQRDFPGLYRQMQSLQDDDPDAVFPESVLEQLRNPHADANLSIKLIPQCSELAAFTPIYQGMLKPEQVESVRAARRVKEKKLFQLLLAKAADEMGSQPPEEPVDENSQETPDHSTGPRFDKLEKPDEDTEQGVSYDLQLDGLNVPLSDEMSSLIDSIIQDNGELPDDYLQAAGPGAYHAWQAQQQIEADPDEVWKGTYHEDGAFLYDEWDCTRQAHRKNWCALREKEIKPDHCSNFVSDTLNKYKGLSQSLRRTFEAMRDENRVLKKQPDGENLDIDALVNSLADVRSGMELSSRIYTKAHRAERNIAVIFMIDMSGSTKGWINTAQREALILLCEALQSLGDRYAIYGFSGMTRKRCELYRVKSFEDIYDEEIKARIAAIEPQDYTRMGVTIRHLTQMFSEVQARTRLLITLSDGKPDDYDSYHGEYGIEDTRMALLEARLQGVHPFCITIDEEARDYLPHMYGHANYVVIDDIRKLPYKVSDIYRKLTS